jgi:flavin reductase (DIM6/NTAB) family NADH-FMN oxidoreductase RutF
VTRARVHDPAHLREVFGAFPTGVTAVAAEADGRPIGLAASSFTSVSLDPPLVSICVAHTSTTWPALRPAARLGVNVLGAHQQLACRRLAGPAAHRFDDLAWRATAAGAIAIEGVSAWLECGIEQEIRAGDHDIVVLGVHDVAVDHDIAPIVFHGRRFRELVQ